MVGQLVVELLMQVFIERARRVSRARGYSPLILLGFRNLEFKYSNRLMGVHPVSWTEGRTFPAVSQVRRLGRAAGRISAFEQWASDCKHCVFTTFIIILLQQGVGDGRRSEPFQWFLSAP